MNIPYKIIYTLTDESPLLSTYSLLPIFCIFVQDADIVIETRDISLSARIISSYSKYLYFEQKKPHDLYYLSQLIKKRNANIIKLPNISASLPQLKKSIKELQMHGYCIPDYIDEPQNIYEKKIKKCYDVIKGSAVNLILRNGNSLRYIPHIIKKYVKKTPSKINQWSSDSRSHVSYMQSGDFYSNERSKIILEDGYIKIVLLSKCGSKKILKKNFLVNYGDIIDVSLMSKKSLINFIQKQIQDSKEKNVLLSIHLKSTMMKISDPIIFGIMVREFYNDIYQSHKKYFKQLKINFNNGISDLYNKMKNLPQKIQKDINDAFELIYIKRPKLAMVNFDNQITNLHIPHGMIIDASMSEMICKAGKMIGSDGKLCDVKAIIPDRCYAGIYQSIIDDCKKNGSFDPETMGSMFNVGLMAEQAEEYGSQNTTFEISKDGVVQVIDNNNKLLFEHVVYSGDIWRLCQTKDKAIENWIALAFKCVDQYKIPGVFWLNKKRQHDLCIIEKIQLFLDNSHSNYVVNIPILSPIEAMLFSVKHIRSGNNVISITGNVLRDYLTDLFPILEVGTSSKMLSVVKLLSGSVLFETGSGGSAPKHFEGFIKSNHLSWNSLGEFLALCASLEHIHMYNNNFRAKILSESLCYSIEKLLKMNRLPSSNIGELDSRGSHFYFALYWAESLSLQNKDKFLKIKFKKLYDMLFFNEKNIINELIQIQGKNVNLGGYYHPDIKQLTKIMRPSTTLNNILREYSFFNI